MRRDFQRTPVQEQRVQDESVLIDDIRSGDRVRADAAWGVLYTRYFDRVAAAVSARISDRTTAEDIVQQAFMNAATHITAFARESSFYTWVYTIARNLAIDYLRKTHTRKTDSLDDGKGRERYAVVASHGPLADRALEQVETNARVQAAIAQLSPELAETIRLREIEGLSHREIAQRQGIPEGTVMSRVFYARKHLRGILEHEPASPIVRKQHVEKVPDMPHTESTPVRSTEDDDVAIAQLRQHIAADVARLGEERRTADERVRRVRQSLDEMSQ